jgi:hypothetical protein
VLGKKGIEKMGITITKERERYEKLRGERSSDTEWWRVRNFLEGFEMEPTEKNLILYLRLNEISRGRIKVLRNSKEKILRHKEALCTDKYYSGKAFLDYLRFYELNPAQSTISRWFKALGGFRLNKFYLGKDLFGITVKALIYKERENG